MRQRNGFLSLGVLLVLAFVLGVAGSAWATTAYVANYGSDSVTPIDRNEQTRPGNQSGQRAARDRDHPGRQDRLRDERRQRHGHADRPCDEQTRRRNQSRPRTGRDRDHPDGKTAYVTNYGSDSVTPIDLATNTAGPEITVAAPRSGSRSRRTARPPTSPTTIGELGDADRPRDEQSRPGNHGGQSPGPRSRSPRTARPPTSPTKGSHSVTPIDLATNTAGAGN